MPRPGSNWNPAPSSLVCPTCLMARFPLASTQTSRCLVCYLNEILRTTADDLWHQYLVRILHNEVPTITLERLQAEVTRVKASLFKIPETDEAKEPLTTYADNLCELIHLVTPAETSEGLTPQASTRHETVLN